LEATGVDLKIDSVVAPEAGLGVDELGESFVDKNSELSGAGHRIEEATFDFSDPVPVEVDSAADINGTGVLRDETEPEARHATWGQRRLLFSFEGVLLASDGSGVQLDVGTAEHGSKSGNAGAAHPRSDNPELGVETDKLQVVGVDAHGNLNGQIYGIEVDGFDDTDFDASAVDFCFIDGKTIGIFKGHGHYFALFL
jgi:hypothetical protein